MADWTPQSRAEEILFKTINGEPYDGLPQSRIEELLLELKDVIESGGGGGGSTVIPNPTGESSGQLNSIGINGVKYTIGGCEVERVTLSNVIIDDMTTYPLSEAYTNFDFIELWKAPPDAISTECECSIIGVDTLKDMMDENRVYTVSGYASRYINMTMAPTSVTIQALSDMNLVAIVGVRFISSGAGGTSNYNNLTNLPQVNSHTLQGDKSSSDLGLVGEDDELTAAQMSNLISLLD